MLWGVLLLQLLTVCLYSSICRLTIKINSFYRFCIRLGYNRYWPLFTGLRYTRVAIAISCCLGGWLHFRAEYFFVSPTIVLTLYNVSTKGYRHYHYSYWFEYFGSTNQVTDFLCVWYLSLSLSLCLDDTEKNKMSRGGRYSCLRSSRVESVYLDVGNSVRHKYSRYWRVCVW